MFEIDWGFEKKTLSISNKKSYSAKGYGILDLPNKQAAQNNLFPPHNYPYYYRILLF
jgi:hypothetical protein